MMSITFSLLQLPQSPHTCPCPNFMPSFFFNTDSFSECCPYVHMNRALCRNMNNPPAAELPKKKDSPSGPQ